MMRRCASFLLLAAGLSAAAEEKRNAYVHVGPHKVASTYIQAFAMEHRPRLAELSVFVPIHPSCGANDRKYFAGVAEALASIGDSTPLEIPDPYIETLRSKFQCPGESGGAVESLRGTLERIEGDVFMSAEDFDALWPNGAMYLRDILNDFDVKVLVMYREPIDRLLSEYIEQLKHFEMVPTLSQFVSLRGSAVHSKVNLDFILNTYCSAFGEENVYVLGYEGILEAGEGIFSAIIRNVMGKEGVVESQSATPRMNVSPALGYMSLWTFIQETLTIQGRPANEIVGFPFDSVSAQKCVWKAAPAIIKDLGNAWTCFEMGVLDAAIQTRDLELLRSRPGLKLFYISETKGDRGLYLEPTKTACGVESTKLALHPNRTRILADMEELMRAVREEYSECRWA